MAFVRVKKRGDRKYYFLVETYRLEDGKPRQRVIRYIGTHPPRGRQKGLRSVHKGGGRHDGL